MLALLSMTLGLFFLLHKKDSWVLSLQILLVLSFLMSFFWGHVSSFYFFTQLGHFLFDGMSLSLIILSFWITILMVMASWMINKKSTSSTLFLLSCFGLLVVLLLCFSVKSMLKFYILFEVGLVPTFYLIMKWGYQPERLQASLYMLLYTICASLPFLITMMFFLGQGFNLDMKSFFSMESFSYENFCWSFFLMLAFFVKMPLYFTHLWLPKAHVEAPVAGSMILAGILLKLGSYGLVRVCKMWFVYLFKFSEVFVTVSLVGGVMTSMICMSQSDLKSLIAYSSIGHMGMLTAGILSFSFMGTLGAVTIMVAHGLCSSGMFFLVNSFYKNSGSRSVFLNKGILIAFPVLTMLVFLVFSCNMAAPPSINLGGELMLSMGILSFSKLSCINIGLLTFLAGGYSIYSYVLVAHGPMLKSFSTWKELQVVDLSCAFLHFCPIWLLILNLKLFI